MLVKHLPEVRDPPHELISLKTAAIPCFGCDEEGLEESVLKSGADGRGGAPGAGGPEALGAAEIVALPVVPQTGPNG